MVDWSISGVKDPNLCNQSAAAAIRITVIALNGAPAGTYDQTCAAFSTSITLGPGSYTASAMLVDALGQPRTTAVTINPFTIYGADTLDVPIDFPSNSFY